MLEDYINQIPSVYESERWQTRLLAAMALGGWWEGSLEGGLPAREKLFLDINIYPLQNLCQDVDM